MKQFSLRELVDAQGLTAVAKKLGVSVPAIHKALLAKRQITINVAKNGEIKEAFETRPFPTTSRRAS